MKLLYEFQSLLSLPLNTMAAQNPNIRFIFGIILIVCGWVICFDLFMLIFGIPFFLLGTILVLFSKKSILVKIITVGLPIILWFVGFQLILHQISKKTPLALFVPETFSGQIRIVDGETNGIEPGEGGGELHIVVPANGIIIVKPHLNIDFEHTSFWYVQGPAAGSKSTRLNSVRQIDSKKIDKFPAVIFEGKSSSKGLPGQSSDIPLKLDYVYHSFYVLLNDSVVLPNWVEESKNDPLTDSLVKVSRGIK